MSDPKHPQKGAPWFIAKSCSVASNPDNIKYCKQSKALFAVTIVVMYMPFPTLPYEIQALTYFLASSTSSSSS